MQGGVSNKRLLLFATFFFTLFLTIVVNLFFLPRVFLPNFERTNDALKSLWELRQQSTSSLGASPSTPVPKNVNIFGGSSSQVIAAVFGDDTVQEHAVLKALRQKQSLDAKAVISQYDTTDFVVTKAKDSTFLHISPPKISSDWLHNFTSVALESRGHQAVVVTITKNLQADAWAKALEFVAQSYIHAFDVPISIFYLHHSDDEKSCSEMSDQLVDQIFSQPNDAVSSSDIQVHHVGSSNNAGEKTIADVSLTSGDSCSPKRQIPDKVCFTTCVFGTSVKEVDQVPNTTTAHPSLLDDSKFRFYLFTNLPDLHVDGWHHVLKNSSDYANNVVASRYGKFLAWREADIAANCRAVFYADGGWIANLDADFWDSYMADSVQQSEGGLAQYEHAWVQSPLKELSLIWQNKKDTKEHAMEEQDRLMNHTDFVETMTMYCNMAFGYNPHSPVYRNLSDTFWQHYTTGNLWRDQPAWNHFRRIIVGQPLRLGLWPDDIGVFGFPHEGITPYWRFKGKVGFNNHIYVGRKRKRRNGK